MAISLFLVLTVYEIANEQTTLGPTVIPDDNFIRHENLNLEYPFSITYALRNRVE